jgi:hypothetical protein
MEEERITRSDVPYLWQPRIIRIVLLVSLAGWTVVLLGIPKMRPSLAELGVGLLFGVPVGCLMCWVAVAYMRDISRLCRRRPSYKWIASFVRLPTRLSCVAFPAAAGGFFFGIVGIVEVSRAVFGPHPWTAEWSHQDRAFIAYAFVLLHLPQWWLWRWYRALPEE